MTVQGVGLAGSSAVLSLGGSHKSPLLFPAEFPMQHPEGEGGVKAPTLEPHSLL